MIDDTRSTLPTSTDSALLPEILQIVKHSIKRRAALDWARNLRFLAYDDPSDSSLLSPLSRKQECSRCYAKSLTQTEDVDLVTKPESLDVDDWHVCNNPFSNFHQISKKDIKEHPQNFFCDHCQRRILEGTRHACLECNNGDWDLCDDCVSSGVHCLVREHVLQKIPVFKFGGCVHVNARSCEDCDRIPVFPPEGGARIFRVVRLGNKDMEEEGFSTCDHFVAVSYCWPSPIYADGGRMTQSRGTYCVKDEDGTVRPNRAPDDIISRAVDFATQNGIRLIWIDQVRELPVDSLLVSLTAKECIDQDNPSDKELGIQAMDKVYQRAFLSLGLLQTTIESQETVDTLKHLLNEDDLSYNPLKSSLPIPVKTEMLLSFFEPIVSDPWHTRAWILQELVSSGPRMILLLRRNGNVRVDGLPGISRILSVTEIVIHLDTLLQLFDAAIQFFAQPSIVSLPATDPLSQRIALVVKKFRNFPPLDDRFINCKWTHPLGKTRPRRTCSAAVALSFLRTRHNIHVPDRLAIVANLCNYNIRLNIVELEKSQRYLGVCVIALALMNGDFSILYPEIYNHQATFTQSNKDELHFTWLTTKPGQLQYLDARVLDSFANYITPNFEIPVVSETGLMVNGYLWKIDRRVHFQQMHTDAEAKDWFTNRQLTFIVHALQDPSFTPETWRKFQCTPFWDHLHEHYKTKFLSSIQKTDKMTSEECYEWSMKWRQSVLRQIPENLPASFRITVAGEFIRVLCALRRQNEFEVADAIWQSVRKDNWDAKLDFAENNRRGCFNSVREFPPENEKGVVDFKADVLWDMFRFDWDRDGGLQQCWVLDRIMLDGYLSVGKFVRISTENEFSFHPEWLSPEEPDIQQPEDTIDAKLSSLDVNTPEKTQDSELMAMVTTKDPGTAVQPPHSMIDDQAFKQLMMSSLISLMEDDAREQKIAKSIPKDGLEPSRYFKDAIGSLAIYAAMCRNWVPGDGQHLKNMRAIFNIDWSESDTLVLTPYDQRTERMPHAEARAMSMSWLVEATGICPDAKDGIREVLRTKKMVKGMWRFMEEPLTTYSLV